MLFGDLVLIRFEEPSCADPGQRLRETLSLPNEEPGEGELLTLLVRLTLGVVEVEDTVGFSSRNTAFL